MDDREMRLESIRLAQAQAQAQGGGIQHILEIARVIYAWLIDSPGG